MSEEMVTMLVMQSTGQMMGSVRLYFLPEYTTDGRQPHHGEVRRISESLPNILRGFLKAF